MTTKKFFGALKLSRIAGIKKQAYFFPFHGVGLFK